MRGGRGPGSRIQELGRFQALPLPAEWGTERAVQGARHVVQGARHMVQGARHVVQGAHHMVQGARHVVQGAHHMVQGARHVTWAGPHMLDIAMSQATTLSGWGCLVSSWIWINPTQASGPDCEA